jgi:hypothetical protein
LKSTLLFNLLIIPILLCAMTVSSWAASFNLAWDASDDPYVAGYRLHYKGGAPDAPFDGTDAAEGQSPIDVGRALTTTVNTPDGEVRYFAITAYDAWGNESDFSNIIVSHWTPVSNFPETDAVLSPSRVDFTWNTPPQEARIVSYHLIYGTDPEALNNAVALQVYQGTAALAGIALFGLGGIFGNRRRFLPLLAACAFFLASGCGGGGGSDAGLPDTSPVVEAPSAGATDVEVVSNLQSTSHTAYDLQPSTTYYWKVVAVDETGAEYESPVYNFTTDAI